MLDAVRAGRPRRRAAGDRRPGARLRRRGRDGRRARSRPARSAATSRTPTGTGGLWPGRGARRGRRPPRAPPARPPACRSSSTPAPTCSSKGRRGRRGGRARPRVPGGGRRRASSCPGVRDVRDAGGARDGIRGPISVFGGAGGPTLAELARIGDRPRELRPGAARRRDGRARPRRRDACSAAATARRAGEPPVVTRSALQTRRDDQRAGAGAARCGGGGAGSSRRSAACRPRRARGPCRRGRPRSSRGRRRSRPRRVCDVVSAGQRRLRADHSRRAGAPGSPGSSRSGAAVLGDRALVGADDADRVALAGRRPQVGDRDVQGGGDPLDRADARAGQPALDLAQEGMGETGEPAEPLERQPAFPAQRSHARAEVRLKTVGGRSATKHRLPD